MKDVSDDPLLECLLIIGKLHNRELSRELVRAGLPLVNNMLTPELLVEAAERSGFSGKVVKRKLSEISPLVLPAVIILRGNKAAVLSKITQNSKKQREYEVIFPEVGDGKEVMTERRIAEEYAGFVIYLKPEMEFSERRADRDDSDVGKSWFWGTLWRYKKVYMNVAMATMFINLMGVAGSLFVMNVYDRVVPNNAVETLWVLASGVTIVFVFDFLLRVFRSHLIDKSGKKADILMASYIFRKMMGLRMSDKPRSSGQFANLIRGYDNLRDFFTSASLVALIDFPFIFVFILFIYLIAGWVAVIPLVAALFIIAVAIVMHFPLKNSVSESNAGAASKHALIIESINAFETVKGIGAEGKVQRKMEDTLGASAKVDVKGRKYTAYVTYLTTFVQQMVTVFIVVVAVYLIKEGEMSMGALIACMILSGRALAPLGQIVSLMLRFHQSIASLQELNKVMAMPDEFSGRSNYVMHTQVNPSIEFQNVGFIYEGDPGEEDKPKPTALKNISLKINPGERVALVGRIGSGKSTILKLMMGFYEVNDGTILVDGLDLRQLDMVDFRRKVGYVPQESRLFKGTVKENILMGRPWAEQAEFLRVAEISGVNRFVSHHPLGYDMMIGEGGGYLSGGQLKSISIAQCLLGSPEVLLMDEPTTSFDMQSEKYFMDKMASYLKEKKRTLVLATHKPSMLSLVERIIVLDRGTIVVDGPKEVVLKKLAEGQVKRSA